LQRNENDYSVPLRIWARQRLLLSILVKAVAGLKRRAS
jgi:hypothetical protein